MLLVTSAFLSPLLPPEQALLHQIHLDQLNPVASGFKYWCLEAD